MKIMSDHLSKQYGSSDWESVVGLTTSTNLNLDDSLTFKETSEVAKVLGYGFEDKEDLQVSKDQDERDKGEVPPPPILRNLSPSKNPSFEEREKFTSPAKKNHQFFGKSSLLDGSLGPDSSVYQDAGDSSFMSTIESNNFNEPLNFNPNSNAKSSSNINSTSTSNFSSQSSLSNLLQPNSNSNSNSERLGSITPQKVDKSSTPSSINLASVNLDPQSLLSSVQAIRLLISGFEKQHALRSMELDGLIDKAVEARQKASERAETGVKEEMERKFGKVES